MKVALILNFPPNDHRMIYTRSVAAELSRRDHDVTLVLQKGAGLSAEAEGKPYHVLGFTGQVYSILGQIRFMIQVFHLLRKTSWDVVHGRNPFSSVFSAVLLNAFLGSTTVIIYDIQGLWTEYGLLTGRFGPSSHAILSWLDRLVMKKVNRIIAISDRLKDVLVARGIDSWKIDVVHGLGTDLDKFQEVGERQGGRSEKRIGYVGAISAGRDIGDILEAFKIALERSPVGLKLVLVGPIHEDAQVLYDLVQSPDLVRHVELTGEVSHDEAIRVIQGLDVALSYDKRDWLPYEVTVHTKLFEYLAGGIPIVATRHPVNQSLLKHEYDAILTEPNPEDFASGILRVITSTNLSQRLARNARETALRHGIEKKVDTIEATYQTAIENRA